VRAVSSREPAVARVFLATLVALIALAWLALWNSDAWPLVHLSHHGMHHLGMHHPGEGNVIRSAALFVGGWMVMSVAMMLPTALPLVMLFTTVVRDRPHRTAAAILLCVGYLMVWTGVGIFAYGLVEASRGWAAHLDWLHANPWCFGSAVCLIAGAFQFSSIKYACLKRCRSPFSFVAQHWSGRRSYLDAWFLGLHHGLFCVGCCWALMLLMLLPAAANPGWMLALAAAMAVEKNLSWGRAVVRPIGASLIGIGLGIATAHLPWI
jgi:predicted metal-binding membrane protein